MECFDLCAPVGHLMGALREHGSNEHPAGSVGVWQGRVEGGEHAVNQFLPIRLTSSKEQVTVFVRNQLVS